MLTMFRRAGCGRSSDHCFVAFWPGDSNLVALHACKSTVLKPDMHNGRRRPGGSSGGRGELIDLPQQDSQGCQSSAQADKGSAISPALPLLAATATQILMMDLVPKAAGEPHGGPRMEAEGPPSH